MSERAGGFPFGDWGGGPGGFRADHRFGPAAAEAPPPPEPEPEPLSHAEPEPEPEPEDPLAIAFAEGYATGAADARAQAEAAAQALAAAHEALGLSFARLEGQLEDELRLRLRDTVAALCEAAIAPIALDEEALMRRIERAVSMLSRADDDRVIRLHPDDLELVSPRLRAEWQVQPDPALERGALRVETSTGGVEDGPSQWRRAIAEALHQC
jgi:flagellar assembly protein FliH